MDGSAAPATSTLSKCEAHGLAYDPAVHTGCALCRKAADKGPLSGIAWAQRMVIYSVLVNLSALAVGIAFGAGIICTLLFVLGWGMGLYGAASLANRLFGVTAAIFSAIGVCIPIVSLLVLLILFGRATKRLRAGGIEVGFLGANPAQFN